MMHRSLSVQSWLETVLPSPISTLTPLHGGCVAEVFLVKTQDQFRCVVKFDEKAQSGLDVEAHCLLYLRQNTRLPVPEVIAYSSNALLMTYLNGNTGHNDAAEYAIAESLASLHRIRGEQFGFAVDTRLGGLLQSNQLSYQWIPFFREHRLRYIAQECLNRGRIDAALLRRLESFASTLEAELTEPEYPSLIHGDIWSGNVITDGPHLSGLIDPALYYAHREIELAFIALFNTFGKRFWDRYHEIFPIEKGFFERRQRIYTLYPLLVHVALFGGSYLNEVRTVLRHLGH